MATKLLGPASPPDAQPARSTPPDAKRLVLAVAARMRRDRARRNGSARSRT